MVAGGGGGGGNVPSNSGSVGLPLSESNVILSNVQIMDQHETFVMNLPSGTKVTLNGARVSTITYNVLDLASLPPAPSNAVILSGYDFGPANTTFSPPVSLTLFYNPATLPAGITPGQLSIAYYSVADGKWVILPSTVDTSTNSVNTQLAHFTMFALIGSTAAPTPTPTATPTPTSTPVATPTPTASTPATTTPKPSPSATPTVSTPTSTPPASSSIPAPTPASQSNNMPLIIGVIVAAVLIVLVVVIMISRRRGTASKP